MANESVFREIIGFFGDIGVYDVVLPFILVFTIIFAILEKTRILGTDTIEGNPYSKKNLNAMLAFVISFLVVASTRLVATINEAMANVAILILLGVGFLMLIGVFFKEGENVYLKEGPMRYTAMALMFIGILLIFLHAIRTADNQSWLEWFWSYLQGNWSSNLAGSIILVIVLLLFMLYIIGAGSNTAAKKKKNEDE